MLARTSGTVPPFMDARGEEGLNLWVY